MWARFYYSGHIKSWNIWSIVRLKIEFHRYWGIILLLTFNRATFEAKLRRFSSVCKSLIFTFGIFLRWCCLVSYFYDFFMKLLKHIRMRFKQVFPSSISLYSLMVSTDSFMKCGNFITWHYEDYILTPFGIIYFID